MGENAGWTQGRGRLSPNGLLPNAGPLIEALDSDRWRKAEKRTAELIACIQPNQPSEERRRAVAEYVQRLIMKCFPCQVFTFGSVPLKTYLPDGDIDLTAFSNDQNLKDTWANEVRDMLEAEEKNENAEFHVKEVQYIQAEVKIIKCLVENIVVDISFNQLGGLCTLCFLEEVDNLINQNHLFKRSIILIKAWCYYESRILGAHHGLISTYALETLVLYIFHVFNNSFAGPLEVLYRFLEFFSNFDWDSFCVSLRGPVPISSLPEFDVQPPRKDTEELLLTGLFDVCGSVYAVDVQENQGQPFVSKYFNVVDPLRVSNNLGRSVSKGNFFRIRSAFAFGAKRLGRLLDCPKENLVSEINQFFTNTWDRHGSGVRPDAPGIDLLSSRLSSPDKLPGTDTKNTSSGKKLKESYDRETEAEVAHSRSNSHQHGNRRSEAPSKTADNAANIQNQRSYVNTNNSKVSDHRNLKSSNLANDIQRKFHFARTRSSPELTDTYADVSSQEKKNGLSESAKNQAAAAEISNNSNNYYHNRKKNPERESLQNRVIHSTVGDPSSLRHPPLQSFDSAVDSNIASNNFHHMSEEYTSAVQEEQDLVNMMASTGLHGFNGPVHLPMNLASGHLPVPISPSFLASMAYAQRNLAGMVPTNIPLFDPAFSNMQFPHGLVSPQLTHYFSGIGVTSNNDDPIEPGNENLGSVELSIGKGDHEFWQEQAVDLPRGFDPEVNSEMLQPDDKPHSRSSAAVYTYIPPPRRVSGGSGGLVRGQPKNTKEKRGSVREDALDQFQNEDSRVNDAYSDERTTSSRFSSAAHSNSLRSKTSSESSWDEPVTAPKSTREKRGKKLIPAEPSPGYGKGKSMSEHAEEEERDWIPPPNMNPEVLERSTSSHSVAPVHVARSHVPGYEQAQPSGSESMIPMAPIILGPGSRQRMADNSSGVMPLTFYPTGPPVPFLTMLPFYNVPSDTGASDSSKSHFGAEESLSNGNISQNYEQSDAYSHSDSVRGSASGEASEERKPDILNSDFASHWQNLQYGRFCQSPRQNGPTVYPSPVMVPPVYLQGRVPWDGPGRPVSTNFFTQLVGYGPRLVHVSPLQPVSNRPPNSFQRYVDEMPRYRSGTGTYLPNPKVSTRDQHSPGPRRRNYNSYDRNDSHLDREGNWNTNSKSRAGGRNHNRSQNEKSNSRFDRLAASESRADRSMNSYRHDAFQTYPSQNGPSRPSSSQGSSANVAYGMYPNPGGLSNGPTVPSVVMLYPYDHNAGYASRNEQVEFGSLGPVGYPGVNDQSQLNEASLARGAPEEHRFYGASVQRSSPDQPSSPHHQRRI